MLSDPEHFFLGDEAVTIEKIEEKSSTASMVDLWPVCLHMVCLRSGDIG